MWLGFLYGAFGGNYSIITNCPWWRSKGSLCSRERCCCLFCWSRPGVILQLHLVGLWFWIQGQVCPCAFQHNPEEGSYLILGFSWVLLPVRSFMSRCMTCQSPLCYQFACLAFSRSTAILLLRKLFYKAISEFLSCKLCTAGLKNTIINVQDTCTRY